MSESPILRAALRTHLDDIMPPVDKYRCAKCREVFKKGWTDEEAAAERKQVFPTLADNDAELVCDDCYKELMAWAARQGLANEPPVLPVHAKSLDEVMTPVRWLTLAEAREMFPDADPDPMPLCPVCGNDAPKRAWCSAACEEADRPK